MRIFGLGAAGPDIVPSDDYLLAPELGLAIVTSGLGRKRREARPAAVLATWAIATEIEAQNDNDALLRGMARAEQAIKRLSHGWNNHETRPLAIIAALQMLEQRARIVHVGRCRVSRIDSTGLVALTEDHDREREIDRFMRNADPKTARPQIPEQAARQITRALGMNSLPEITDVDLAEGDEVFLASSSLQDALTPELIARLCDKDKPITTRATDLWDHFNQLSWPFSFILLRIIKDDEQPAHWTAGSRRPAEAFLPPPGQPFPPLPIHPFRAPDEQWEKAIATPIAHDPAPPLAAPLAMMTARCSPEIAVVVLIRSLVWTLDSLAKRWSNVPESLVNLRSALARTNTLTEWGPSERTLVALFMEWADDRLSDWASDQARSKVAEALDCLFDWSFAPDRAEHELSGQLDELVCAEGLWDWDELLAEADLADGLMNDYLDRKIVRDEQEMQARRAFLNILGELVEPPKASNARAS